MLFAVGEDDQQTVSAVVVGESGAYGYGWMIAPDGTYSHTGSDGTMAWVDPARQVIGMVLTQSPGGINPTREFRETISAAPSSAPRPSPPRR